jgi:hypothetical protein
VRASSPVFLFSAHVLVFDSTEGARSRFHILRSQTHFQRYRGRRVLYSCFALSDSFLTVVRVLGPVFIFCAHVYVLGGTEGVRSLFNVVRSRTHLGRYRGHRVSFSCFALPDTFWTVPRAQGPVFIFSAPGLVFGGIGGVRSRFHVLRLCDPFSRAPHRLWAMGCGRRTRRSLPSVHLFNAG